jgi:hypothetical protein
MGKVVEDGLGRRGTREAVTTGEFSNGVGMEMTRGWMVRESEEGMNA